MERNRFLLNLGKCSVMQEKALEGHWTTQRSATKKSIEGHYKISPWPPTKTSWIVCQDRSATGNPSPGEQIPSFFDVSKRREGQAHDLRGCVTCVYSRHTAPEHVGATGSAHSLHGTGNFRILDRIPPGDSEAALRSPTNTDNFRILLRIPLFLIRFDGVQKSPKIRNTPQRYGG